MRATQAQLLYLPVIPLIVLFSFSLTVIQPPSGRAEPQSHYRRSELVSSLFEDIRKYEYIHIYIYILPAVIIIKQYFDRVRKEVQ